MYHWPLVWLVWNQLYDNWNFCFYLQNRLIQKKVKQEVNGTMILPPLVFPDSPHHPKVWIQPAPFAINYLKRPTFQTPTTNASSSRWRTSTTNRRTSSTGRCLCRPSSSSTRRPTPGSSPCRCQGYETFFSPSPPSLIFRPNKLECYITLCWKCLPWTNTLAYWVHL